MIVFIESSGTKIREKQLSYFRFEHQQFLVITFISCIIWPQCFSTIFLGFHHYLEPHPPGEKKLSFLIFAQDTSTNHGQCLGNMKPHRTK